MGLTSILTGRIMTCRIHDDHDTCGKCSCSEIVVLLRAELKRIAALKNYNDLGDARKIAREATAIEEKPSKPDVIRVDRGEWRRAGGDATCDVCGCVYYDHPTVPGYRWLHRACNGNLLKL